MKEPDWVIWLPYFIVAIIVSPVIIFIVKVWIIMIKDAWNMPI